LLLPALHHPTTDLAAVMPDGRLTYAELAAHAAAVAERLPAGGRVALWATPSVATVAGMAGALRAGVPVVPLNPTSGTAELEHILADARPSAVLAAPGAQLPPALGDLDRLAVDVAADPGAPPPPADEPPGDRPALVMYTSGTTGPPKGVVQTRDAIAANLDALFAAWAWTGRDVLAHALPLFHVHGLVIGTLGPLRLGGRVEHLGAFDPGRVAAALADEATMLFGVPTMYHRLAEAAEGDEAVAAGLGRARLLVSGSAALAARDHERIERATGQQVVERYGMTETLMITSVRVDGERRPGYVGVPLDGVELRVVGEDGADVPRDDATVGAVRVRSAALFAGYLDDAQATAAATVDGWFDTGDLGALGPDGYLRLVGRRSTDLIKSGGYRIGAGEIETALTEHPAVAEAAVLGLPDEDLGERIVAWIVPAPGAACEDRELIDHVARELTPHKRPREIRRVQALPRNAMGKVQKARLRDAEPGPAAS
jgi:malonyl-CoA/methylmalonyl-CoA synthetase